jgi:uncharacterized protein with NAD-binding domain and iron-sulfur cluster
MNGIQFYLREPTPIVAGPLVCLDSPWVVFGISQAQFWPDRNFPRDYGDGRVRDKFSAIITDWTTPGILYGKPAVDCTTDEIAHEAWAQIQRHLQYRGAPQLSDDLVLSWFLDPGIVRHHGRIVGNDDPLFLPTVNSWADRPTADTHIPNLVLASDYVQVDFDITSMEGANEAARRAVNVLLDRAGSTSPQCEVFLRQLPPEWAAFRQLDEQRYKRGEPNLFDADLTTEQLQVLLHKSDPSGLVGDVRHLLTQLTTAGP